MPVTMHSDNGTPFASVGLGGLRQLAVWWLRLGIRLERSWPACPQDNGAAARCNPFQAPVPSSHGFSAQNDECRLYRLNSLGCPSAFWVEDGIPSKARPQTRQATKFRKRPSEGLRACGAGRIRCSRRGHRGRWRCRRNGRPRSRGSRRRGDRRPSAARS